MANAAASVVFGVAGAVALWSLRRDLAAAWRLLRGRDLW